MATKIQPLGPRVLIKRLDEQEESSGGIIIPDTAKEKPQEAEVVSLGTGGKDENGNDIEFTVKKKRQSPHIKIWRHRHKDRRKGSSHR